MEEVKKTPPRGRSLLRTALGILLLLIIAPSPGRPDSNPCAPDPAASGEFTALGLELIILESQGAALISRGTDAQPRAMLWFAYSPAGALITSIQGIAPQGVEDELARLNQDAVPVLSRLRPLAACPTMGVPSPDTINYDALRNGIRARLSTQTDCSQAHLKQVLETRIPGVDSLVFLDPGFLALLGPAPGPRSGLWFGWTDRGVLVTQCYPGTQGTDLCNEALAGLKNSADIGLCPGLQVPAGVTPPEAETLGVHLGVEGPATFLSWNLDQWVRSSLMLLILLFLGLIMSLPRQPLRRYGLGLLLFLLALGIRALSSARLPVNAANGDFTILSDVEMLINQGLGTHGSEGNVPGPRMMLYLLFQVFPPSWNLAAWFTTVLGAALVLPVAIATEQFSGNSKAGFLSGLAAATWPLGVFFSNGVNHEIPAAFFLTVSFAGFAVFLNKGTRRAALLHATAGVIAMEMRPEAILLLFLASVLQLLILLDRGRLSLLRRTWWCYLVPGVPAAIYLFWFLGLLKTGYQNQFLSHSLILFVAWTGSALVLTRLGRLRFISGSRVFPVLAAGLLAIVTLGLWSGARHGLFLPTPWSYPELPGATIFSNPYLDGVSMVVPLGFDPGVIPALALPLILAGVLPSRVGRRLELLPLLLPGLVVTGYAMTMHLETGILILETWRYRFVEAGLLLLCLGLGIARLLDWSEALPEQLRRLLPPALALILLLPLATHHQIMSDTRHNPQEEFLFVQDMLRGIPDQATLILPVQPLHSRDESQESQTITRIFRIQDLLRAEAFFQGKALEIVEGLDSRSLKAPRPAYVYLGLDCARVQGVRRGLAEACKAAQERYGREVVLQRTIPNRGYSSALAFELSPLDPELTLQLLEISE